MYTYVRGCTHTYMSFAIVEGLQESKLSSNKHTSAQILVSKIIFIKQEPCI